MRKSVIVDILCVCVCVFEKRVGNGVCLSGVYMLTYYFNQAVTPIDRYFST